MSETIIMMADETRTITRDGMKLAIVDTDKRGRVVCTSQFIVTDEEQEVTAFELHDDKRSAGLVR